MPIEMYQDHLKNHFSEMDDRKIDLITVQYKYQG
jgi:hypothetical protein